MPFRRRVVIGALVGESARGLQEGSGLESKNSVTYVYSCCAKLGTKLQIMHTNCKECEELKSVKPEI